MIIALYKSTFTIPLPYHTVSILQLHLCCACVEHGMINMMLTGGESRAKVCKSSPDEREGSAAAECGPGSEE